MIYIYYFAVYNDNYIYINDSMCIINIFNKYILFNLKLLNFIIYNISFIYLTVYSLFLIISNL